MIQKGFLRNKNKFDISKKRFWTSVIVGLITSFSVYTFFCLFRFVFRTMDFGYANWALIIDPKDRYWQNFIFAISSLIFGNSLLIIYLFKKPVKSLVRETRRSNIINNQYFLVFNYFYLFVKLAFLVTVLALSATEFNRFLSPFKEIVFLIVIVLYLESWKSVIRIYRIKSYKYIILNAIIIVLLAFVFSFTSVFDYEKYDAKYELSNPYIDFPQSKFISENNIYYFKKLKIWKQDQTINYSLDGQKVSSLKELAELLESFSSYEYYFRKLTILILAPNDISFVEIKKIEKLMFGLNINRIKYIVKESSKFEDRYSTKGIQKRLLFKKNAINKFWSDHHLKIRDIVSSSVPSINFKNNNFVDIKIGDKYYFNDKIVPKKILVNYFKNNISDSTVFHYHYNKSISYQKYITLFSAHREAVDYLRRRDQLVKIKGDLYYPENKEEYEMDQRRLIRKYPLMYLDNNDVADF